MQREEVLAVRRTTTGSCTALYRQFRANVNCHLYQVANQSGLASGPRPYGSVQPSSSA